MSEQREKMKQEFFQIDDSSPRKRIVRQDRVPMPSKKVFAQIGNHKLEVINVSSFGMACLIPSDDVEHFKSMFDQWGEMPAVILFNNVEAQRANVKLARIEPHPQSVFNDQIAGLEVFGCTLAVDRLRALELTDEMLNQHNQAFAEAAQIPMDFKLLVYEMKSWLLFLKEKIDAIEKQAPVDNAKDASDFKQTVAETVAEHVGRVIPEKYLMFPKLTANLPEKTLAACIQFIRTEVGHLLYGAPFASRAYFKPRGYAGDFEMMNHLYRSELVGLTLFDQCMHKYFVDEPSAQAVKNRGLYLVEQIRRTVQLSKKSELRILAIASGPAMEQQLFLNEATKHTGKKVHFTCLDQDEESLKHAQRQILSLDRFVMSGYQFKFINLAIRNIIARGLPETGYDLIYSAGLFDYFSDPVAQMAASKMFEALNPGGRLIIGNFSKENPNQPFMEMILDWHLIYRSPEEMVNLFKILDPKVQVDREPLGINLFAVMQK